MDLAALDIKIGADLSQLQKDLNSAGVIVDQFSKDLATIGATSAAAAGGMSTIATGAIKITEAFKQAPTAVHALEESLGSIANEFNNKWNPIVEQAGKLPVVLDQTADKAKILQRQFAAFAGVNPFKNIGVDLSKFSLSAKDIPGKLQATRKASSEATLALSNLGRVAQDLPFGFIGIANNLNPLLEGFQRLAKESKATGVSIGSTLLKSLTGAGGLGLALSVVSAALTFASFGLSAWTRGFGDNKKAIDEAKEALDGYLKNAADEITNLRILEKVATDTSNSYDVRIRAVNELQKLYPFYLKNLSDEAILNGAAAKQIDLVAAALAKKAYFQASERELQQIADKQLKARKDEVKLIGIQQQAELDLKKAQLERTKPSGVLGGSGFVVADESIAVGAIDAQERALEKVNKQLKENRKTQQGLTNDFTYFLNVAESFKDDVITLDPDPEGKVKAATKDVETIADVLAKLKLELSALSIREFNEGLNLSSEKITEIEGVIKKLIVDFKVPPDATIINKLFGDIKDIRFSAANFKDFVQNLEKSLPPPTAPDAPKFPIKIAPIFDKADFEHKLNKAQAEILAAQLHIELPVNWNVANQTDIEKFTDQLLGIKSVADTAAEAINNFLQSLATDTLVAFGEALGTLAAGADSADIFGNLFQTIGSGLKALGKTMIEVSGLITAIKVSLSTLNPVLAIAAGIALTALGSFIESQAPKLAEGGIVPAGFPNDTFLARLSSNEAVIPLDKGLSKFLDLDNQTQFIVLETKVSGDDLLILGRRAERKSKRTF